MQPYYIITKYDTELIRFKHTEVEKFSQTNASGYDTYVELRQALDKKFNDLDHCGGRYKLVEVKRGENGSINRIVFNEPEFMEDVLGNKERSTIEIFIAKAAV